MGVIPPACIPSGGLHYYCIAKSIMAWRLGRAKNDTSSDTVTLED
ncbi:unnamed protein product [Allacma fusca]|uniref:Uncharacterized protein n=1 Tax=Allacma fusca TaxID=39272 RepID=A0A8J2PPB0_9HEXA|nr:unnamed protein product [Allacma fusca]